MAELQRRGRRYLAGLTGLVILTSFGSVRAQPVDIPKRPMLSGYLGPAGAPDEKAFLSPPPADSSIAGKADLEIFRQTRGQQGTFRWSMAASDAAVDPASLARAFSCAIGARWDPSRTPALAHLLGRSMADAFLVIGPPKNWYARPRPFRRAEGALCVAVSPQFARSGSYPSGHSTAGWLYALILSELAPDRSGAILARGRAFGESRVICGVHYASDVEAGRTAAAGLFAVLQSSADFQADAAAARSELADLRRTAAKPDAAACAAEAQAERIAW